MMKTITKGDTSAARIAAIGMFDGVHTGHRHLIATLVDNSAATGLSPVVVTFVNHPRDLLRPAEAPRSLTSPEERSRHIADTPVEGIIMLSFDDRLRQMSAFDFLTMLRDDYNVHALVLGFNNHFGHNHPVEKSEYDAIGDRAGVKIIHAPEYRHPSGDKVSSSVIRRLLQNGDITQANLMLGYCYRLSGTVVHGKELGRTIGFPTANILPADPRRLVPANGVYAVRAHLANGEVYPAMVNIGHRPTVDSPDSPESIEAHIIGFDGCIYGQTVELEFLRFLRKEQRFESLDALRHQLAADAQAALTCPN
ncbi:MAG: riboflavin biosynthesis protein RibF [Bacteroides sp.]|nr:riboflavin biosynthesis protein RibF [Bacteroides sp.]